MLLLLMLLLLLLLLLCRQFVLRVVWVRVQGVSGRLGAVVAQSEGTAEISQHSCNGTSGFGPVSMLLLLLTEQLLLRCCVVLQPHTIGHSRWYHYRNAG